VHGLERAERMMVRWMCGVTLKDRKCSEEILDRLGIESVAEVVRSRLRRCGHIVHMSWLSVCREIEVEGSW